jgi:DNA transformation protein and related proteins
MERPWLHLKVQIPKSIMMIKQKLFCQQVIKQLGQVIEVKARAMFGGYGLYSNTVMFGLIDKEKLYFKVDEYTADCE